MPVSLAYDDNQYSDLDFVKISARSNPQCEEAEALISTGLRSDRDLIKYVWENVVSLQSKIEIEAAIERLFPDLPYRVQVTNAGAYGQIDFCKNRWNIYGPSVLSFGTRSDGVMRLSSNVIGYSDVTEGLVRGKQ